MTEPYRQFAAAADSLSVMRTMSTALSLSVIALLTSQAFAFTTVRPTVCTKDSLAVHTRRDSEETAIASVPKSTTTRRELVGKIASTSMGLAFLIAGPANASTKDPKTGVVLPSVGEIESALPSIWDDDDNPFLSMGPDQFSRLDKAPDSIFYTDPRFVEHVDENAVKKMTSYISDSFLKPDDSVLDMCSSWTSHIDQAAKERLGLRRVAGLGMNEKELSSNPVLTEWKVEDLNKASPKLPYEDSSFDAVLCQLSIDYLTRPLEVMREVGRVLKPGGRVAILFSNRLFIQKAVGLWTGADDIDHAYIVGSYLAYSNGGFENIKAEDLSQRKGGGKEIVGDPLYVVTATKKMR